MDPWYSMGAGDMLKVASMGVHVAKMTSIDGMHACFNAVTENAARLMGLEGYGRGGTVEGDEAIRPAAGQGGQPHGAG